ncbi:MAG: preprotein translocase subunit TatB [Burkholderiaceae bacterium]
MKIFLLRIWIVLRRFRRNGNQPRDPHLHYAQQVEALMRRVDPAAPWRQRADWMIDLIGWLRHEPRASAEDGQSAHPRTRFLLDWLDAHRDVRRLVQHALQKTLREARGSQLFADTGLPRESAFFSELGDRMLRKLLPQPTGDGDASVLLAEMFPEEADAEWLLGLDAETMARLWRLCADDGIAHAALKQIDEALVYLATMIVAAGIGPEFQQRLEPRVPLMATPFMALRRELEKFLMTPFPDDAALRSVRMLVAVCQAQTERIYAHLDEHGVSVRLVYSLERMREQLARVGRLADLRHAAVRADAAVHAQALLADLVTASRRGSSVRGLLRRSFALLSRKTIERSARDGEQAIARDAAGYRALVAAAGRGGIILAVTVIAKFVLDGFGVRGFFEGLLASLNFAVSFVLIYAVGGVLATRQPAATAPLLAARMRALDTIEGLRALLVEIAALLRSQAAAVFGNVAVVIPTMLAIAAAAHWLAGAPIQGEGGAHALLDRLSPAGPTTLFAAMTGVLLGAAGLFGGFVDNWFAFRRLPEAVGGHRRLARALGARRAQRFAAWLDRRAGLVAGNLMLGVLLGMTPAVLQFFGVPFEVRHVTLDAGMLAAASASLGWQEVETPAFGLAAAGVLATALINVGVAFACVLSLSLRARQVPRRTRRVVRRSLLRALASSPRRFLFPERRVAAVPTPSAVDASSPAREEDDEARPAPAPDTRPASAALEDESA